MLKDFYSGKKVFLTGHTGFKGSWICRELSLLGAEIYGYSLKPPTDPCLYDLARTDDCVVSKIGDIRDLDKLESFYIESKPDIVIHLAAQPIVLEGYRNPHDTFETNIMGTVNLLECVRRNPSARSFLNVTTDKVYENLNNDRYFREDDKLDGYDPYSNSKSCSDLVTHSYRNSFFSKTECAVTTARAGNVIGGGDFAADRIMPDCIRAAIAGRNIFIRNPNSVRPYQHVLEPLYSYLEICARQYRNKNIEGAYNVGPDRNDCITTGDLATIFCEIWGNGLRWETHDVNGPHEANYLKLDNRLLKEKLGISPLWNIRDAVEKAIEWTKVWQNSGDIVGCMESQIREYLKRRGE